MERKKKKLTFAAVAFVKSSTSSAFRILTSKGILFFLSAAWICLTVMEDGDVEARGGMVFCFCLFSSGKKRKKNEAGRKKEKK